jgi:hypothetical protein
MRFFTTVNPGIDYIEGRKQPPAALMEAMGPYMEKAIASGELISTAGLKPVSQGVSIVSRDGKVTTVDGPYAEAKEMIGGYAVIEAPDREAALRIARDFVDLHIRHGMVDISVDVREIEGGYNY